MDNRPEQQQEQASLYVVGALAAEERRQFEAELRGDPGLRALVRSLERTADLLAMALPPIAPAQELKSKVLRRVEGGKEEEDSDDVAASASTPQRLRPGFMFHGAGDPAGWKQLPVRGAWVKLLSLERERGYAVLLGKLEAGVRYPAHAHAGAEELFVLTGDLHIGDRVLGAGDFHHSDTGTAHGVNYSVAGCTLLAVLPADHELVRFAMG